MKREIVLFVSSLFWSGVYCAFSECTTPLGVMSNCVPLHDCPELAAANEQEPKSERVFYYLKQSICGTDAENVTWICCSSLPSPKKRCTTPLGATSYCVSLPDCPELLTAANSKPVPQHILGFLKQSQCGYSGNTPKVCCGSVPRQYYNRNQYIQSTSQQNGIEPVVEEDSMPETENTCGVDTSGDRIYGGTVTDLQEFPWMALLGYSQPTGLMAYACGGTLINHRFVLTAAHCIAGDIQIKYGKLTTVRLGEYDKRYEVDCIGNYCNERPQEILVMMAVVHSEYTGMEISRPADIGLVKLAKRAKYSDFVKPICLVSPDERLRIGSDVYVSGWGQMLGGRTSPVKLKLAVPMFDKNECIIKYQRQYGFSLSNKQICAGGIFKKDTCQGDSGGPLMRMRPNGVWDVVGIISFGFGCGRDGWPGVYTSVASYVDWVQGTMKFMNV